MDIKLAHESEQLLNSSVIVLFHGRFLFPKNSKGGFIMKRTHILCPNCFNKKLLEENKKKAYCDGCGQEFTRTGENSVQFK